ncbi:MAG: exonuclease SbcCD subunit D [Prevotella sp.]|nr:exonuclease SbcCD subunit D [Prevotella sp.]
MKILHTSDWHLGHELYNYKRADEFEHFFSQLTDIVKREQPDAMLVSGDVFHSAVPSASAQTMYTEALLQIHEASPEMEMIITAGNHDSASRLEIDKSLWHHFRVHVIGMLDRTSEGVNYDSHIIRLKDKGYVAAVPHVFKQNFPGEGDAENRQRVFYQKLAERMAEVNTEELPMVLMAHVAVDEGNSSYEDVGGMEYFPYTILGEGYDYIALGHLHRPHKVPHGNPRIRYCGAPVAISFNEEYEHSVTLAELTHFEKPRLQVVPIHQLRPVRTIPIEPVEYEEALKILCSFPDDDTSYVCLNVKSDVGLPVDSNERALAVSKDKKCRFCKYKLTRERQIQNVQAPNSISVDEFISMQPEDIARRYLESEGYVDNVLADFLTMMKETTSLIREEKSR